MDTSQIEHLHRKLLNSWNRQDAKSYASLFAENGSIVGFDGSQMNSRDEIESEIGRIFADHTPANQRGHRLAFLKFSGRFRGITNELRSESRCRCNTSKS